jgi:hypothetical protein
MLHCAAYAPDLKIPSEITRPSSQKAHCSRRQQRAHQGPETPDPKSSLKQITCLHWSGRSSKVTGPAEGTERRRAITGALASTVRAEHPDCRTPLAAAVAAVRSWKEPGACKDQTPSRCQAFALPSGISTGLSFAIRRSSSATAGVLAALARSKHMRASSIRSL